jgi:hypothetical protein
MGDVADLDYRNRDSILNLANRYGLLGLLRLDLQLKHHYESHLAWAREIAE